MYRRTATGARNRPNAKARAFTMLRAERREVCNVGGSFLRKECLNLILLDTYTLSILAHSKYSKTLLIFADHYYHTVTVIKHCGVMHTYMPAGYTIDVSALTDPQSHY